jgi:benzil reductase ((S)-benzoin forming)
VVITGVSRGLGAELFAQLLAAGDRVVGIGRRFTDHQRAYARTTSERVSLLEADLAHPASLPDRDALAPLLADATGTALIHNAAVVEPIGAVGTLPADQLPTAVAVNLTSPMLLTNAFLAALPADATATILYISSGAAHRLVGGWATYSATKRGGEAFFDALAAQAADAASGGRRIRVTNVNPGVMDTGMQGAIREAAGGDGWFPDREAFVSLHANGELPDPAEVARALIREHLTTTGGRASMDTASTPGTLTGER